MAVEIETAGSPGSPVNPPLQPYTGAAASFLADCKTVAGAHRNNHESRLYGIDCFLARLLGASLVINLQDIRAGTVCSRPTSHAIRCGLSKPVGNLRKT
jgi:hypothetical protein